jgi:Sugar-transfer associated ATP-grasp
MEKMISLIGRVFDIVRYTPIRVVKVLKFVNDPVAAKSYYSENKRKSKFRILLDNFWWVLQKGEVNYYYFLYGFDRDSLEDTDEYLGSKEFWGYQKRIRNSSDLVGMHMDYQCLVHDKLVFNSYLAGLGFPTPKTVAVGDNTGLRWFDGGNTLGLESILYKDMDVFCKYLLGEGGLGVFSLKVENGKLFFDGKERSLDELRDRLSPRWMIQERIYPHPQMSKLYPHCVNTMRLVTTLNGGQPKPLFSYLRVGNKGSACDSYASGGITIGIDMDSGTLLRDGFLKPAYGTRVTSHPETGSIFENFEIPFYKEALELAIRLHSFFYGIHSIGWDIAITRDGPCIIEANDQWFMPMSQGIYGGLRTKYLESYPKELLSK